MKIPDLLDGLAERLRTIDGLTVTTDPGANVAVPMAIVSDGDITYNATMGRGSDDVDVVVSVYVSRSESSEGAFEVRDYKSGHGDNSIRTALETSIGATDTLATAGVMVRVDSAASGISTRGDASYIVVNVSLLATVSGTT